MQSAPLPSTPFKPSIQGIRRLLIVLFLITVFAAIRYSILYFEDPAWQVLTLIVLVVTVAFATLTSLYLLRRGKVTLSVMLAIGSILLVASGVAVLIDGLGLPAGIAVAAMTVALAVYGLPARIRQPFIITGVVVGVALVLFQYFGPRIGAKFTGLTNVTPYVTMVLLGVILVLVLVQFKTYNLRNKLLAVFLIASLAPALLIAYVVENSTQVTIENRAKASLVSAADQTAFEVDEFIQTATKQVENTAQLSQIGEYLALPPQQRTASEAVRTIQTIFTVAAQGQSDTLPSYELVGLDGTLVYSSNPAPNNANFAGESYFTEPLRSGTSYVSPVVFDADEPSLYFSSPVRNSNSQIVGVLVARYPAEALQRFVNQTRGLAGQDSFAILLDDNKLRLASESEATNYTLLQDMPADQKQQLLANQRLPNDTAKLAAQIYSPELSSTLDAGIIDTVVKANVQNEHAGDEEDGFDYYAIASLQTVPWHVLFHQGENAFLSAISGFQQQVVIVTLVLLLIATIAALVAARFLTEPILRLITATRRISEGDLTTVAEVTAQDEIGVLAQSFNAMTDQLRGTLTGLEQRNKIIENSSQVSRRLSTILNPQQLTLEVVEQMRSAFNYYHAHIYLLDDHGTTLKMVGGTGRAGRAMLANNHQIPVGRGLVGRAAQTKEIVLVPDVSQAEGWLPNPLLPETKAEIAVPIMIGQTLLGVLDVQQNVVNGLTQDDAGLIQSIADQVAIGLDNARSVEQITAQQELLKLRERAITASNDGIVISDPNQFDMPIVYVNPAFERITGYSSDEVVGKNCRFLQGEDNDQPGLRVLRKALREKQACRVLIRNYRKDGSMFWNELDISPVFDEQNQIINFIGVQQDVTDRVQAEIALQEANQLQSAVLNSASYMMIATDPQGIITVFNPAAERNLGYQATELIGKQSPGIFHDVNEVVARAAELSQEAGYTIAPGFEVFVHNSRDGSIETREWTYISKDNRRFPIVLSVSALRDQEGTITGFLGIANDISERKQAEVERETLIEQIQDRAIALEAVAEVGAAATSILDSERLLQTVVDLTKHTFRLYHAHIYLYNQAHQTLDLHVGAGEVGHAMVAEGRSIALSQEQSLVAQSARRLKPVVENDTRSNPAFLSHPLLPETRSEMAVPLIVGQNLLGVLDVQAERTNAFDSEDQQIYLTLAGQIAVALQNARLYADQSSTVQRLQELDQLKSAFLANMSHELRTPLNSILGFTEVILEGINGPINDLISNDLTIIHRNGRHLLNLINDILDMAKIESGKLTLFRERFDLYDTIQEVVSSMGPLAGQKHIDVLTDDNVQPGLHIYADRFRIRQVLLNVVGNAVKFTDAGHIAIDVQSTNTTRLIHVRDTGIGIPEENLDSIFVEFQQVDNSTTRKAGGTGLGLPISRHLVAMHGGNLSVSSSGIPGEGSVFTIEIPIEPLEPIGEVHAIPEPMHSASIE